MNTVHNGSLRVCSHFRKRRYRFGMGDLVSLRSLHAIQNNKEAANATRHAQTTEHARDGLPLPTDIIRKFCAECLLGRLGSETCSPARPDAGVWCLLIPPDACSQNSEVAAMKKEHDIEAATSWHLWKAPGCTAAKLFLTFFVLLKIMRRPFGGGFVGTRLEIEDVQKYTQGEVRICWRFGKITLMFKGSLVLVEIMQSTSECFVIVFFHIILQFHICIVESALLGCLWGQKRQ